MRVDIEEGHIGSYERIAREANKAINKSNSKFQRNKYERILLRQDISAENKKKILAESLHELIVKTFSVKIKEAKANSFIENLKANIALIRKIRNKTRHSYEWLFLA